MFKHFYALHGWTGCGADFDLLRTSFEDDEYKWTCPDLLTPKYLDVDFDMTINILKDEFDALPEDEERILMGYSMGGRLALHLAKTLKWRKNDRFIVVSASPELRLESERSLRRFADNGVAEHILEMNSSADFFELWLQNPIVSNQKTMPKEWFEKLLKNRAAADFKMWAQALVKWGQGTLPSLWNDLEKISESVDTMLICGEEDEKYFEIMAEMKNYMPKASFATVRRSHHTPQFENSEKMARIIKRI